MVFGKVETSARVLQVGREERLMHPGTCPFLAAPTGQAAALQEQAGVSFHLPGPHPLRALLGK